MRRYVGFYGWDRSTDKTFPVSNEQSGIFALDRTLEITEYDGVKVSTVFLMIDHGDLDETPLLFETMIFGGKHDLDQRRYGTAAEARIGHREMCQLVELGGKV